MLKPVASHEDAKTTPGSVKVSASAAFPPSSFPPGATTTRTGRSKAAANSRSRESCPGTAITAPLPYEPST